MQLSSGEKKLLRRAAAIPLRLIYDCIPKEHLELFLPYVVMPTGRSDRPHICYLLSPEELDINRNKIWPEKFVSENSQFIECSMEDGRPYMSGHEKARIYVEIEKHSNPLDTKDEPIYIEVYDKTYGQLKSSDDLEYRGVEYLYPMAIFCKQQNGLCFLVASADYTRSPYGDFQAIRWKEHLSAISSVKFWDLLKPELCDVDVMHWQGLRIDAVAALGNNFGAHHMLGGSDYNSGEGHYESEKVHNKLVTKSSWNTFIRTYDYKDCIDGDIVDWEKPPVRALIDTAETDKGSQSIAQLIDCFEKEYPGKVSFVNKVPATYGYLWFNFTALLKGIFHFRENSTENIQVTMHITLTESFKGAVIKIHQISDRINTDNLYETQGYSRYLYNEDFPCPRGKTSMRTLKNAFRYFKTAGASCVIYRAFDVVSKKYLQSIIKLKGETDFEIINRNLPSNNMFDGSLCLIIPAEENNAILSYRNDDYKVLLVSNGDYIDFTKLKEQIS